jgi:hypothetical protein
MVKNFKFTSWSIHVIYSFPETRFVSVQENKRFKAKTIHSVIEIYIIHSSSGAIQHGGRLLQSAHFRLHSEHRMRYPVLVYISVLKSWQSVWILCEIFYTKLVKFMYESVQYIMHPTHLVPAQRQGRMLCLEGTKKYVYLYT